MPAAWTTLKVIPPESTAKCGYVVIAGLAGVAPGTIASGTFGFAAPQQPYYYVLAHCNLDGSSTVDGYYFQSSVDSPSRWSTPATKLGVPRSRPRREAPEVISK